MSAATLYDALRAGTGIGVAEPSGGAVRVTGSDATKFLQSLVSADLDAVADGEGAHSLLLTPQGKLDVDFRALRVALDDWLLLTTDDDAPRLVESLTRFKIRVDVEIADASSHTRRLAVLGAPAPDAVSAALGLAVPPAPHAHGADDALRVVRSDWPEMPRVEITGQGAALEVARADLLARGADAVDSALVEVLRIEAGVPSPGSELGASTIAQEAFLERDAVSFTKGCFLGQELVCRIDTRGHVNRFLRGLRPATDVEAGRSLQRDGRDVGTITSVARSPRLGPIALAYVRREVEPGAMIDVADGAPVPAEVVELPFPVGP